MRNDYKVPMNKIAIFESAFVISNEKGRTFPCDGNNSEGSVQADKCFNLLFIIAHLDFSLNKREAR